MYMGNHGDYMVGDVGSLKSFFKKVVKVATKLSPSHAVAKALKIDKFSPSHILVNKLTATPAKSSPKTPPSAPVEVPAAVPIAANTPDIPVIPTNYSQQPMMFGSGGGGGSSPAPLPAEGAPVEETDYTPWIIGAAAVGLVAFLALKKKR